MGLRILSVALIAIIFSCTTDNETLFPDPLNPQQETFKASLLVEVINQFGDPLDDVEVHVGAKHLRTNPDGVAYLKNIPVAQSTYITAVKDGFFLGSRRLYPTDGQTSVAKIMLLENTHYYDFDADADASFVANTVRFNFLKNSITTESGDIYHGQARLAVQLISAGDPSLFLKMPGDLTGENTDGETGILRTYGMITAEVRSTNGELLKIKNDLPVHVEIPVPANMLNSAPSELPMWYFDEEKGIWKEEGSAQLAGSYYVTSLGHFSTWNCDVMYPQVRWSATVRYSDGTPAGDLLICTSIPAYNFHTCTNTNLMGVASGITAPDQPLDLKVFNICHVVVYAAQLGPISVETVFPDIILAENNDLQVIQGVAVKCNNQPVTNGYATARIGGYRNYTDIQNSDGQFTLTVLNCDEEEAALTVFDNEETTRSAIQIHEFATNIDVGQVSVCLTNEEFIELTVSVLSQNFSYSNPGVYIDQGGTFIHSNATPDSLHVFGLLFEAFEPGTYDVKKYSSINIKLPDGSYGYAVDPTVHITYYGEPGDYIIGTVSGMMQVDPPSLYAGTYPFHSAFTVLRD